MLQLNTLTAPDVVEYPDSDGLPMADNSKQFHWITTIAGNLDALYRNRPDILVGGNMLWYAREGDPAERCAPDVFVVFGQPKGHRGSYKQWVENDVPMTVVFEILSPGNTWKEMIDKVLFYSDNGTEEFYIYDPETNELTIYLRGKATLRRIYDVADFVSPRMGIRFDLSGEELVVRHPDGRPFLTFKELEVERAEAVHRADLAKKEANLAKQEADLAKREADLAFARAKAVGKRFARLVELMQSQSARQATAEELTELQRLLQPQAEE